jgi:hypothetical protein
MKILLRAGLQARTSVRLRGNVRKLGPAKLCRHDHDGKSLHETSHVGDEDQSSRDPNGIPEPFFGRVPAKDIAKLSERLFADVILCKVARWDADKCWEKSRRGDFCPQSPRPRESSDGPGRNRAVWARGHSSGLSTWPKR